MEIKVYMDSCCSMWRVIFTIAPENTVKKQELWKLYGPVSITHGGVTMDTIGASIKNKGATVKLQRKVNHVKDRL